MITEVLGWIGTVLILVAYLLVSTKKLPADSRPYQLLNLIGVIGVGVNVWHQRAWPALGLQIAWGLIALVSLGRMFFIAKSQPH